MQYRKKIFHLFLKNALQAQFKFLSILTEFIKIDFLFYKPNAKIIIAFFNL